MKPSVHLKKLRQRVFSLNHQLEQLEALDPSEHNREWFEERAWLKSQIARLTGFITEEESREASNFTSGTRQ